MNFTFGITTMYDDQNRINQVIKSIRDLNIPKYEIIVIGYKEGGYDDDTAYVQFNEGIRPGWITRKKNILVDMAGFENVVLMHDYYVFDKNWYKSFVEFGNDWDVCSNQQQLINGQRHFTDWVTWDDPLFPRWTALPYDEWTRTQYMYISGGYFIVKNQVALDNPFNEELLHGDAEDVEWSLRIRDKYLLKCNGSAIVRHNKRHRDCHE